MARSKSEEEQWMVESQVLGIYHSFFNLPPQAQSANLELQRDDHMEYLTKGLRRLGPSFTSLDAKYWQWQSRPWLCYWMLHSITLLNEVVDDQLEIDIVDFLSRCQDPNGGYGGGPGQMPHLATTYAAVNSLITIGGERALSSINRKNLYSFLIQMKDLSGGFRMHYGGELDVRACYTAISVASVLNILDNEFVQGVGNYILSCQTYEGGIAGEPWSEAHGGYTFCGLAAMVLINEVHRLDLPRLINWLVFRQGIEGGFQGRTNKLVDGCYSFWQGGAGAIIQRLNSIINKQLGLEDVEEESEDSGEGLTSLDLSEGVCNERASTHNEETSHLSQQGHGDTCDGASLSKFGFNFISRCGLIKPFFEPKCLQQYILLCSQVKGGFRDKPGKNRDHYHTCYCLSGLSISQYSEIKEADYPPLARDLLGSYSNLLEQVHPLYNIVVEKYHEAREFFSALQENV
ncbi:acyltransferase [Lithospermum erythrorhizon]|uniref:Protein farnesyltransferase subunit beta n=1 Tax=Lithospermum erythrorhizon TaxID=34254 RepID=A0AAV3RFL1_LITER